MKNKSSTNETTLAHRSLSQRVRGWVQIFVMRKESKWTQGKLGTLEARKHKSGRVEIYITPKSKRGVLLPEYSLWVVAHKDNWIRFSAAMCSAL